MGEYNGTINDEGNSMTPIRITSSTIRDAIEPMFDAGRVHNLTFKNFEYDKDGDVAFDVIFPSYFTKNDFIDMCREYQLDELIDLIEE